MKNKIDRNEFNRMVTAILLKFMEFCDIKPELRNEKLKEFNNYIEEAKTLSVIEEINEKIKQNKNEQSIQQRQNDETSVEQV